MVFKEKSIEEIFKIKDHIDMISELYSYLVEKSNDGEDFSKLTLPENNFYLCYSFLLEVNNGGFYRFFWNVTGNYTDETTVALKLIKAEDTAKILEEAKSLFPEECAIKDRLARQDFMNDDETPETDDWEDFDQRFFKNEEDIESLCYKYAIKNKEDFK